MRRTHTTKKPTIGPSSKLVERNSSVPASLSAHWLPSRSGRHEKNEKNMKRYDGINGMRGKKTQSKLKQKTAVKDGFCFVFFSHNPLEKWLRVLNAVQQQQRIGHLDMPQPTAV